MLVAVKKCRMVVVRAGRDPYLDRIKVLDRKIRDLRAGAGGAGGAGGAARRVYYDELEELSAARCDYVIRRNEWLAEYGWDDVDADVVAVAEADADVVVEGFDDLAGCVEYDV